MLPPPGRRRRSPARWTRWLPVAAALTLLGAAGASQWLPSLGPAVALAAAGLALVTADSLRRWQDRRAPDPASELGRRIADLVGPDGRPAGERDARRLSFLAAELDGLRRQVALALGTAFHGQGQDSGPSLTRSGMYEPPEPPPGSSDDTMSSGDFSTLDMVGRLHPRSLRWLDSSPAAQSFLGWSLAELKETSFLEVVHPDDRALAREQLHAALLKGEAHGLVFRVVDARGEVKSVEVNVGVRYGPDMTPTHLRCHLTDVTAKLRAERELKRRTKELTRVNERLRHTVAELEELKDRYGDLYQNAPAMYFSLDRRGIILDCNDTMLRTLGYRRGDLIGRPFIDLLLPSRRESFAARHAEFLRTGSIEVESRWIQADGRAIDVWVAATAVRGPDGTFRHSRSVARDVTARRALEAELKEKNERLARINDELSRKNRELDEFTYVVSHDLQEPLRTLIAFSDFLLRDHGERLDAEGQEYVRYLVEASRRMRALINDLLNLSRAGKVTGEFGPVDPNRLLDQLRADLAELVRSRGAEIRVAGALPMLYGDRDRIGQLFGNLIGNGLKYNRAEAPIVEVGARPGGDDAQAVLYVKDNGIGIAPEYHDKIFQIFRRLHARDEYEGTGAGLAICQKIVQAHGGRIWVESRPGEGATFFVTLPRPPAVAHPRPPEAIHAR